MGIRLGAMRAFASLPFLVGLVTSAVAEAKTPPPLPEVWREFIELDQQYNIEFPTRQKEILSPEAREPTRVYQFEVPADQIETHFSKYIGAQEKKAVLFERNGKQYVRIFAIDKPGHSLRELTARYGAPTESKYWATKLQSHSTYFMWDPDSSESMMIKFQKHALDETYNAPHNARRAVKMSEFVEGKFRETPSERFAVLGENFSSVIEDPGAKFRYAYSLRSTKPYLRASGQTLKFMPLHGFLGSPKVKQTASKLGLSVDQWVVEEYIPKLAQFFSEMHFKYGVHPEGHTQNLLIRISEQTGRIEGFVTRDMNDMLLDPLVMTLRGKATGIESLASVKPSIMNRYFVDLWEGRGAGPHAQLYDSQSVVPFVRSDEEIRAWARRYLEAYLKETSKHLGFDIQLPDSAYRMRTLDPYADFSSVTDAIHFAVTKKWVSDLAQSASPVQKAIAETTFKKALDAQRVVWAVPGSLDRFENLDLRYEAAGNYLVAIDSSRGNVLGVALDLSKEELALLAKALLKSCVVEGLKSAVPARW
jgi:hypothetical protein